MGCIFSRVSSDEEYAWIHSLTQPAYNEYVDSYTGARRITRPSFITHIVRAYYLHRSIYGLATAARQMGMMPGCFRDLAFPRTVMRNECQVMLVNLRSEALRKKVLQEGVDREKELEEHKKVRVANKRAAQEAHQKQIVHRITLSRQLKMNARLSKTWTSSVNYIVYTRLKSW